METDYDSVQRELDTNRRISRFVAWLLILGGVAIGWMGCVGMFGEVRYRNEKHSQVRSANNMRNIILAMHTYESNHKKLPQNITDKNGKPLLSWRVHLLPFLEDTRFYEEFHLDEPWDSEHNIKLLERIPPIYRDKLNDDPFSTNTPYLAPVGKEMLFGNGREWSLGLLTGRDGTSNTIALVEVDSELAVPWTKPVDYPVDFSNPKRGLLGRWGGGFLIGMFDGTVPFLSENVPAERLMELYTPDGMGWGQAAAGDVKRLYDY